jgi:hypothetical protein
MALFIIMTCLPGTPPSSATFALIYSSQTHSNVLAVLIRIVFFEPNLYHSAPSNFFNSPSCLQTRLIRHLVKFRSSASPPAPPPSTFIVFFLFFLLRNVDAPIVKSYFIPFPLHFHFSYLFIYLPTHTVPCSLSRDRTLHNQPRAHPTTTAIPLIYFLSLLRSLRDVGTVGIRSLVFGIQVFGIGLL